MASIRTPVLIAGAGPTGLALAIELASRGVGCLVVERNDRVGYAPRAKTTHTRTREHLRRWGIADKLAEASPFGIDYPSNVFFVTRLAGHQLAKLENAFNCAPARNPAYSEHAQWIPQYKLEEVLRAHAESLPGVELRFSCEFESATQSAEGVESRLTDLTTREVFAVESDFLVGADGARSKIRDLIGATLEGAYGLSRNYNIVFRAPGLAQAHRHGPGIMYWQVNADAPSLIGPMDSDDRWFFMPTNLPADLKLSDNEAAELIRKSTGIDLPYEILSRDEWVASRFIADRYRDDRIFLAGDACHLHPPFGGYGMNMGVADAVDLGWKLAGVLSGWGGPALLDSYELERREVHRQVIDEAVANHAVLTNQLLRPGVEDEGPTGDAARAELNGVIQAAKRREFHSLGVVLGYCYGESPIIDYAGETPKPSDPLDYQPSAAPGRLAPHAWLADGRSLYDLFGPGFTLLVTATDAELGAKQARDDAAALGLPLQVVCIDDPHVAELYKARLALIRPDQHVAWRGDAWPGRAMLARVSGATSADAPAMAAPRAVGG
jgi:2-polyprenyl-6-methoxyphenol hydroxylase-like FAD-dependent oxidoreductase